MSEIIPPDYFRRDQERGISAPDLSKVCEPAEHIVHARGKKTAFTSVSLDATKIDEFGPTLYSALTTEMVQNGHAIIEHGDLINALKQSAASTEKAERVRALRAIVYAKRHAEGLINWKFDISSIPRKDIITFGFNAVQRFFKRM